MSRLAAKLAELRELKRIDNLRFEPEKKPPPPSPPQKPIKPQKKPPTKTDILPAPPRKPSAPEKKAEKKREPPPAPTALPKPSESEKKAEKKKKPPPPPKLPPPPPKCSPGQCTWTPPDDVGLQRMGFSVAECGAGVTASDCGFRVIGMALGDLLKVPGEKKMTFDERADARQKQIRQILWDEFSTDLLTVAQHYASAASGLDASAQAPFDRYTKSRDSTELKDHVTSGTFQADVTAFQWLARSDFFNRSDGPIRVLALPRRDEKEQQKPVSIAALGFAPADSFDSTIEYREIGRTLAANEPTLKYIMMLSTSKPAKAGESASGHWKLLGLKVRASDAEPTTLIEHRALPADIAISQYKSERNSGKCGLDVPLLLLPQLTIRWRKVTGQYQLAFTQKLISAFKLNSYDQHDFGRFCLSDGLMSEMDAFALAMLDVYRQGPAAADTRCAVARETYNELMAGKIHLDEVLGNSVAKDVDQAQDANFIGMFPPSRDAKELAGFMAIHQPTKRRNIAQWVDPPPIELLLSKEFDSSHEYKRGDYMWRKAPPRKQYFQATVDRPQASDWVFVALENEDGLLLTPSQVVALKLADKLPLQPAPEFAVKVHNCAPDSVLDSAHKFALFPSRDAVTMWNSKLYFDRISRLQQPYSWRDTDDVFRKSAQMDDSYFNLWGPWATRRVFGLARADLAQRVIEMVDVHIFKRWSKEPETVSHDSKVRLTTMGDLEKLPREKWRLFGAQMLSLLVENLWLPGDTSERHVVLVRRNGKKSWKLEHFVPNEAQDTPRGTEQFAVFLQSPEGGWHVLAVPPSKAEGRDPRQAAQNQPWIHYSKMPNWIMNSIYSRQNLNRVLLVRPEVSES